MKVLKELVKRHKAALNELAEIEDALKVEGSDPRAMTPEEEQRSLKILKEIDDLESDMKREARAAKRQASVAEARSLVAAHETRSDDASRIEVSNEPMQYGINSDGQHSYFADLCRYAGVRGLPDPAVAERLATWAHQVEREIANDSKRGREARKQLLGKDGIRTDNGADSQRALREIESRGRASIESKSEEFRAGAAAGAEFRAGITTGGGATASAAGGGAAAFVVPVFYESDYAPWRHAGRAFADQCNQRPLPDYGMTVYLPAVQGPAGITTQTEGQGITETDPTAGFLSGGLITTAGQVTITQQLLDRAGPNVSFDQILFDQLNRAYNPQWDQYVLTQALAAAGTVSFGTGWQFVAQPGTESFVAKTAGAINAVETTAGTIMSPSHLFVQPKRWNFIESVGALESTSGTLHPLVVPLRNGPFNAVVTGNQDGSVPYEGQTGYSLLGLPIYKDLNIPAPGTGADQAIVGNLNEVYVYEGPLVPRVVPQTFAANLQVLLQLYSYGTTIVRYPSAIQKITGAGMAAITF